MGWTSRPVRGAAIHRMARLSTSAPRVWKMRLVLAFCRPKPIWMPKKPTHMFQIDHPLRRGRVAVGSGASAVVIEPRSEERRVGEGRGRWGARPRPEREAPPA